MAAAVIEGPHGLLLVQNRRHDGRTDWSPPAGVVEPGELVLEGLGREVLEETGLSVGRWSGLVYEVDAVAPDLGWHLRVQVHRAHDVSGELVIDDPDGIVVDVGWFAAEACRGCLADAARWVREPLETWLAQPSEPARTFRYRIDGTDRASLAVSALDP